MSTPAAAAPGATPATPRRHPRVFLAGIRHESCGFTSLRTTLADFRVQRGASLLQGSPHGGGELDGALGVLHAAGANVVPGLLAGAAVSGLVEPAAWEALTHELLGHLTAALAPGPRAPQGPLDGVLLLLHGSLSVEGVEDAQGELLAQVRRLVGADTPVVVSLDLHAAVTPRMVQHADALVGYRTAPHRDQRETGERAAHLLLRMWREQRCPAMVQVHLPLLLPGEFAQTDTEPTASLWRLAEGLERSPAIWCVSLLDGFPWADMPYNEASVVVVGEGPAESLAIGAEALAGAAWAVRDRFYASVPSYAPDEGLRRALEWAAQGGFALVSDSGDNPTAGAPQDRPSVVEALLAHDPADAVVALLVDPPAVHQGKAAGVGADLVLQLGGQVDPGRSPSIGWEARVAAIHEGTAAGSVVVLRRGGVAVVVGERRLGMTHPDFLHSLGLDPFRPGRLTVLKIGYLFPAYADALRARTDGQWFMLRTPGATTLDLTSLPYRRVHRPLYPLDAGDDAASGGFRFASSLHPARTLPGPREPDRPAAEG
jgi:microcystin degradation protein MlrC